MEAREVTMFEKFVSPEVYDSLQRIASGESQELVAPERKLSPAQKQMAQKSEDAQQLADVLENIEEGINGEQCVGKQEYFFSEPDESKRVKELKQRVATALCRQCPVVSRCLERSIEKEEEFGIWGGQGEYVRRKLIRKKYDNNYRNRD